MGSFVVRLIPSLKLILNRWVYEIIRCTSILCVAEGLNASDDLHSDHLIDTSTLIYALCCNYGALTLLLNLLAMVIA